MLRGPLVRSLSCFFYYFPRSCTLHDRTTDSQTNDMVRTDDAEVVWDKPNEVDEKWVSYIDDNVLASKQSPDSPSLRVLRSRTTQNFQKGLSL